MTVEDNGYRRPAKPIRCSLARLAGAFMRPAPIAGSPGIITITGKSWM